MFKKMQELKAKKKTMVFVSHSMAQVKSFCDRAIWIYQGKMRMDGPTEEVTAAYLQEQG